MIRAGVMMNLKFEFDLKGIDYDKLHTEADFKNEAKRLLPAAMNEEGRRVAEALWIESQKKLGLKESQKQEFIEESEGKFAQCPNEYERIEKLLILKIKEGKRRSSPEG